MTSYRYPNQGGINLNPWTKPDGKPRCTARPKWLCPKCNRFVTGGAIKAHREKRKG
jgi:hypothetical protein